MGAGSGLDLRKLKLISGTSNEYTDVGFALLLIQQ